MKEIKFSKQVYSKDFSVKSLGYDCHEVDAFFDEINEKIVMLERKIEQLTEDLRKAEGKNSALEQKNKEVSYELYNTKAQNTVASTSNANFSNMELYNRISSLEKMVKKLLDMQDNNKS